MSQYSFQRRPSFDNSAIPNVIFVLLVANGLAFAAQQLIDGARVQGPLMGLFALWPPGSMRGDFMPWQLVSYGFLHDTRHLAHILFNMFALWMFGRDLERTMGPRHFLIYYMTCVVGAGIVQLTVASMQGGDYPTIGASGGVFGLLLAYGMFFPNRTVMLLFPPIPMRAKYFVIVFGLLELYLGVTGFSPGIANFAHLGGMLFGFILLQYWRGQRRR